MNANYWTTDRESGMQQQIWHTNPLKVNITSPETRFSEPRFSEMLKSMDKFQLPFSYFTLYPYSIYLVNWLNLANKRSLTTIFTKSSLGSTHEKTPLSNYVHIISCFYFSSLDYFFGRLKGSSKHLLYHLWVVAES